MPAFRPSRLALSLLVALASGCAAPLAPQAPGEDAASLGAEAPGAEPAVRPTYALSAAAAEPRAVVVRYRGGRGKRPSRGRHERALRLAGTELFAVASAEEREALLAELRRDPDVLWAEPDGRMYAMAIPDDPRYGETWAMPKIGAPAAWDRGRGAGVTVAVVDTGVDGTHPDLAGRLAGGYDVVNLDADPTDDEGHGTHVAGTIGATFGNALGVAGVAPEATLLAYKVLDADGSGTWSDVADGIVRAADAGAKVINLSLGGFQDAAVVREAVAYALARDVVVAAAAGNENTSRKSYPAAYPGVIAVGATTRTDARASFSNYGSWLALAAPGVGILSTTGGGYEAWDGTSMAAPHVAGAAAVLRGLRPTWTRQQVLAALQATGAPTTRFTGLTGLKRLDLGAATAFASDVTPPSVLNARITKVARTSANLAWGTSEAATSVVEYGRTDALGTVRTMATSTALTRTYAIGGLTRNTTYSFRVRATDRAGNEGLSAIGTFTTSR